MLSFITEQLQARAKAAAEAAAVEAVNEEAQMNDAILECAHLVQELDDLSIEGTQADSTRPFTKIDIPLEDDPEITSVEMNLLDGRITNIPTDATVQESDTVYVGMRTPEDFFQEAMMETSQFMRETDEAYRNRVEDIARQKFAAYKTYCIQEGLFGFDKLSVNDSRVPARLSIDFGKMNGRDYAVKLPVKFEVDKKNRILKKQLDSVMAFHNTTNNSSLLQDAAFSAFGQKVGVENADEIWSKVTPVELVVPVKPSDKFCVAVGFELDGTGDDLQYIEWHAPIKGSKDGIKTETTTPSIGEIKKLSVMTKGEAIRQEAALIASGYHAPDRFMQEAIDFGDPNEPPAADPNAASVSFDAPPAADGMQQPAGADAPPAEGDAAAAPPEGDPAAEAPAEGTEDKEIVDTNNVSDQIAEKVADETQADAAAENDINVDGMDVSDSEGDQPTEEELNAELGDAPAEGTEDTVDSAPADTSDADFDNMTMDEMLAQGQEKMKGMTMQQIKAFLQGDYTGMAEAPPPSDDAPAPEDEGVQESFNFVLEDAQSKGETVRNRISNSMDDMQKNLKTMHAALSKDSTRREIQKLWTDVRTSRSDSFGVHVGTGVIETTMSAIAGLLSAAASSTASLFSGGFSSTATDTRSGERFRHSVKYVQAFLHSAIKKKKIRSTFSAEDITALTQYNDDITALKKLADRAFNENTKASMDVSLKQLDDAVVKVIDQYDAIKRIVSSETTNDAVIEEAFF